MRLLSTSHGVTAAATRLPVIILVASFICNHSIHYHFVNAALRRLGPNNRSKSRHYEGRDRGGHKYKTSKKHMKTKSKKCKSKKAKSHKHDHHYNYCNAETSGSSSSSTDSNNDKDETSASSSSSTDSSNDNNSKNGNNDNKTSNNNGKNVVTETINIKAARRSGGFLNANDVCLKESDDRCPCYPEDDDWYCGNYNFPWRMKAENVDNDGLYEKCDESRIPTCKGDTKLCPMRKPRLDRFYNEKRQDMYYYIDYDCIQCVPNDENCSKCSPGLWCPPLGRCVGPSLVQWCKKNYPDEAE